MKMIYHYNNILNLPEKTKEYIIILEILKIKKKKCNLKIL